MPSPKRLLSDVLWSCDRTRYPTPAALLEALREYERDILGEERFAPDTVVLETPAVDVTYPCWTADDDQISVTLQLLSAHPEHFTALDLLYKILDGMAEQLVAEDCQLWDHHFFEGLTLESDGDPPDYYLRFGS
jgi:hypothetical protein